MYLTKRQKSCIITELSHEISEEDEDKRTEMNGNTLASKRVHEKFT
jgi:hypothetical protein